MIVVVGGSSRKAGKTSVICEIVAATAQASWTVLKITPHDHEPGPFGDTERYLAAGATHARLEPRYEPAAYAGNVILESNSVMEWLVPDLFVFVEGNAEWKPSALRYASKAHFRVRGHATPELIAHIRAGAIL